MICFEVFYKMYQFSIILEAKLHQPRWYRDEELKVDHLFFGPLTVYFLRPYL